MDSLAGKGEYFFGFFYKENPKNPLVKKFVSLAHRLKIRDRISK